MNMKNKKIKNKGFTLFELLVSISIIALLTAIAVVSFGGVNKKARDSRRGSDLEKIRIALESYRQVNGTYPVAMSTLVSSNFLQALPTDPKDDSNYAATLNDYTYSLGALMEDSSSTNCSSSCGSCGSASCNYKVINP